MRVHLFCTEAFTYLKDRVQLGHMNSAMPHILFGGTGSYFFLHNWQRDTWKGSEITLSDFTDTRFDSDHSSVTSSLIFNNRWGMEINREEKNMMISWYVFTHWFSNITSLNMSVIIITLFPFIRIYTLVLDVAEDLHGNES